MFTPTNIPFNTPFNAFPNTAFNAFGCPTLNASPFANPYFTFTLNTLITQAVQQAIWQTMQWNAQFGQTAFQQPFQGTFPFPGTPTANFNPVFNTSTQFPNFTPQPQHVPGNTPNFQGYQGNFPQGTPGWLNGQTSPGYFGTGQFQGQFPNQFQNLTPNYSNPANTPNTPTNEVVEAATKRNGSR